MSLQNIKLGYTVSSIGLFLMTIIHILSLFYINTDYFFPFTTIIGSLVFIPFFYAVITNFKRKEIDNKGIDRFYKFAPNQLKKTIPLLSLYVAFNFIFCIFYLKEGGKIPVYENDKYLLKYKGRIIRELSHKEYEDQRTYDTRFWSGHVGYFYFACYLMFLSLLNEQTGIHSKDNLKG